VIWAALAAGPLAERSPREASEKPLEAPLRPVGHLELPGN